MWLATLKKKRNVLLDKAPGKILVAPKGAEASLDIKASWLHHKSHQRKQKILTNLCVHKRRAERKDFAIRSTQNRNEGNEVPFPGAGVSLAARGGQKNG